MRASAKCNSQNRGVRILSLELWWLIDCTHFMFYRHAPMVLILHVIVAMASMVIKNFLLKPWILLNRATDSLELWFLLFIGNRSITWNRRSQQTMIRFHLNIFLNSLLLPDILIICLYSNEITVLLRALTYTENIVSVCFKKMHESW